MRAAKQNTSYFLVFFLNHCLGFNQFTLPNQQQKKKKWLIKRKKKIYQLVRRIEVHRYGTEDDFLISPEDWASLVRVEEERSDTRVFVSKRSLGDVRHRLRRHICNTLICVLLDSNFTQFHMFFFRIDSYCRLAPTFRIMLLNPLFQLFKKKIIFLSKRICILIYSNILYFDSNWIPFFLSTRLFFL